jgi:hypothetical protein
MRARAVGGAVFLFMVVGGVPRVGDDPASPTLLLRVTDFAGLSRRTLDRAAHEVSLIYRTAGVDTIWVDRSTVETGPADRAVEIILLSEELSEAQIAQHGLRHDDVGYAIPPAQRTHILWPRIRDLEVQASKDSGEVLGLVIAHEVGHLLLPDGHSSDGIMRPEIDVKSRQRRQFTRAEVELLRSALGSAWPEE